MKLWASEITPETPEGPGLPPWVFANSAAVIYRDEQKSAQLTAVNGERGRSRDRELHRLTAGSGDHLHFGYLSMPEGIRGYLYPEPCTGLAKQLELVAPTQLDSLVEVIYVQPEKTGDEHSIDFETFAAFVERREDDFSKTFASHLRCWRLAPGAKAPAELAYSRG